MYPFEKTMQDIFANICDIGLFSPRKDQNFSSNINALPILLPCRKCV